VARLFTEDWTQMTTIKAASPVETPKLFRPAPPHNPSQAPAMCLCVECCQIMLTKRCPARNADGVQCGKYRHRGKEHTMIPATVFLIAEERTRP
jgi:hypothetical protein